MDIPSVCSRHTTVLATDIVHKGSFHTFTHAFMQRVVKRTVQSFRGGRIVTARNRRFKEISRATQSCGFR